MKDNPTSQQRFEAYEKDSRTIQENEISNDHQVAANVRPVDTRTLSNSIAPNNDGVEADGIMENFRFLEIETGFPYSINPSNIGYKNHCSHAIACNRAGSNQKLNLPVSTY